MSIVKMPITDFKEYDRKLIQLNRDVAILLHLFKKDAAHSWEDAWLHDVEQVEEADYKLYEESAKQFINQLEGNWSIAFLTALRNVCDKVIESDTKYWEEYNKNIKHEQN